MTNIATELDAGVLAVRFDRPEKKNALTADMYAALASALGRAEADPAVRAVLFLGSADAFTAGNDLNDFLQSPPSSPDSPVLRFLDALRRAPKPLVAAVNGVAIGVGTTMLLHCDLVYASTGARFQVPFVDLGLCPEAGSSVLLPASAGHRRAAEYLLLGNAFGAHAAREAGVVTAVVEGDAGDAALAAARALAAKPAAALRLTKALMKRASAAAVEDAMNEEARHFLERLGSPEAREAFSAFLEKRRPDFSRFD